MLLRFGVKNFRSFREYQELSLIADRAIKDENLSLFEIDNISLNEKSLPVSVVYGANASGKSNLVNAFLIMKRYVSSSHLKTGDRSSEFNVSPFLMSKQGPSLPTLFEVDFVSDGVRYFYNFEVFGKDIVSERYYYYPRGRKVEIFVRENKNRDSIKIGASIRGPLRHMLQFVRTDSLFASTAMQNASEEVKPLMQFFENLICVTMGPRYNIRPNPESFDDRIVSFLSTLDTGITGHRFIKSDLDEDMRRWYSLRPEARMPEQYELQFSHKASEGGDVFFKLNQESDGTRRLVSLLRMCLRRLDRGGVIVIDELDASLHSRVAEAVIELFSSKDINKGKAQLIATTHDTNLMTSDYLRRDQIWFAEKDGSGATSIYPLTDFRTRKSDNIEKGYLQGRYGAVPYGGSISHLLKRID